MVIMLQENRKTFNLLPKDPWKVLKSILKAIFNAHCCIYLTLLKHISKVALNYLESLHQC